MVQATPSLWHGLLDARPDSLHGIRALVGGEPLTRELADRLGALTAHVTNLYGPTETTIWSLAADVEAGAEAPPIGLPLPGIGARLLDVDLAPLPPDVPGDLYLTGPTLATGYLGHPGLTATRFIADPAGSPSARMYRTGDVAARCPDGRFVFHGRADDQMKIHGHRVEPGEIEAVLARDPLVRQVAVAVCGTDPVRRRIVAYAVPRAEVDDPGAEQAARLRSLVAQTLPPYMVPTAVIWLRRLPLTPNGKLDRQALPEPGLAQQGGGRPPSGSTESALAQMFAEVLGIGTVSAEDGFFDLGGNSLLAVRLIGRIDARFTVDLGLRELFAAPTVAALAALLPSLRAHRPALQPRTRPARVPLSHGQQRLWFANLLEGSGPSYNLPITMDLTGPLDTAALRTALVDLVVRHEALRTLLPDEDGVPYQLVLPAVEARPEFTEHRVSLGMLPQQLHQAVRRGFDLAAELPIRASLWHTAAGRSTLLIVTHHSAADGWSTGPLLRDLLAAYRARLTGEAPDVPPLPVQYADYTLWQRELLTRQAAARVEFWSGRRRLLHCPPISPGALLRTPPAPAFRSQYRPTFTRWWWHSPHDTTAHSSWSCTRRWRHCLAGPARATTC